VLLIGDETAVPAVASILASLAPSIRVDALLEVPTAGDRRQLPTDAEARIQWLPREGAEHGSLLEPAVRAWLAASADAYRGVVVPTEQELAEIDVDRETLWDSPVLAGIDEVADAGFYAWIAGESAVIKTLRRVLVTEHRIDRHRVAFMGYWRQGQSEKQG
jgi:NADPH-dependent ferric siderophore reductase